MRKNRFMANLPLIGGGFLLGYAMFISVAWFMPELSLTAEARSKEKGNKDIAVDVQNVFRKVSGMVLPSIVEVTVQNRIKEDGEETERQWNDFFKDPEEGEGGSQYFRSSGLGSGIIVDKDDDTYFVVTNAHVIGETDTAEVRLFDGKTYDAKVLGRDERKDLAVLGFDADDSIAYYSVASLGDSNKLYVGDLVLSFGSPYGYEHSVSMGIVSALSRKIGPKNNINEFIQTDASINQGNSGGALVNIRGEIVGVNTFITTPNRGSVGLGFAIPVNNVKTSFRQIIDSGKVVYGWLGVSLGAYGPESAISLGYPEEAGVMVYQVYRDSPAFKSGIRPGDLILSLDGIPVEDRQDLIYRIGDKYPSETVDFEINRFGKEIRVKSVLGKRETEEKIRTIHDMAEPGLVVAPLVDDVREKMKIPEDIEGVVVAEVYPRSSSQAAGLRPKDIITILNGMNIDSMKDLYLALSLAINGDFHNAYTVYREGDILELARSAKRDNEN